MIKKLLNFNLSESINNPYPTIIRYGLFFVIILASMLGWSSRYVQNTSLLEIIIFSLFLFDQMDTFKNNEEAKKPTSKLLIFLLFLTGIIFITNLFTSIYQFNTAKEIFRYSSFAIFFYLVVKYLKNNFQTIVKIVAIISFVLSIIGLYDIVFLKNIGTGTFSLLGWRNTFGGFIILLFPFILTLTFKKEFSKRWQKFFFITTCLLLINLYFTFSQASWLAFLASLLLLIFFLKQEWKKVIVKIFFIFFFSVISIISILQLKKIQINQSNISSQVITSSAITPLGVQNRIDYWLTSLEIFKHHPFFGVGLGNFGISFTQYQKNLWSYTMDPHNIFLLILAEAGIGGVVLLILLFFFIIKKIIIFYKNREPQKAEYYYSAGLISGLTASLLHNLLDFDWQIYLVLLIWILFLALFFSLNKKIGITAKINLSKHYHLLIIFFTLFFIAMAITLVFSEQQVQLLESDKIELTVQERELIAKKAVRLNPFSDKNYRLLVLAYVKKMIDSKDNLEENKNLLFENSKKVVQLNPQDAFNHFFLADSYLMFKNSNPENIKLAEEELKKALELDKYNRSEVYSKLISLYNFENKTKERDELINRFLNLYNEIDLGKMFLSPDRLKTHQKSIEQVKNLKEKLNP